MLCSHLIGDVHINRELLFRFCLNKHTRSFYLISQNVQSMYALCWDCWNRSSYACCGQYVYFIKSLNNRFVHFFIFRFWSILTTRTLKSVASSQTATLQKKKVRKDTIPGYWRSRHGSRTEFECQDIRGSNFSKRLRQRPQNQCTIILGYRIPKNTVPFSM